ncbi:MAG TPA: hypothetical protein VHS05_12930 [Pyrinomonadaceae bacterium]|nr:hypothetical protein [Pyrinomonadaceae bacterium]
MADDIWILEDQPVRVTFDTKGATFYKGGRGVLGLPIENHLRLIAVKDHDKVEVPTVSDLKGRVVITSKEEALEFVRLFTSRATHYLFPDNQYLEPTTEDQQQKNLALKPVTSEEENGAFVIERNLVSREGKLVRATERVTPDGEYSVVSTEVINEQSPIPFPIYQ